MWSNLEESTTENVQFQEKEGWNKKILSALLELYTLSSISNNHKENTLSALYIMSNNLKARKIVNVHLFFF